MQRQYREAEAVKRQCKPDQPQFLNAVLYVAEHGCKWRGLPKRFGNWHTTLLIGRIGLDAEAKMDKNQQEFVVFSIATQDLWKTEQGEYDTRTEWHRVYAWRNLLRFAKTLQKGQLLSVDGQIRYREYAEEVNGTTVKHRVAEIHAIKIQRLTKSGAPAPSDDQASDE